VRPARRSFDEGVVMRRLHLASVVLVGALLLTGCGGGDDDEASDDTPATLQEDTGSEGDDDGSGSDDGGDSGDSGDDGDGPLSAERCSEAAQAMAAAAAAVPGSLTGEGGELEESLEQLEAFADAAPGEIRDDLRLIAEATARLAEALEDAGIEPGEQPSAEDLQELQEIGEDFDDEELQSASERVNAWFEEECGQ
jgi:hypothetical protein